MSKQLGSALTGYLVAVLFAVISLLAWTHFSAAAENERQLREQAEITVKTERGLREDADKTVSELHDNLEKQRRRADANRDALRKALAAGPDCRLSASAGGVLRHVTDEAEAGPVADGAGGAASQADPAGADRAGDAAGRTGGDEGVSCKAIAVWAQRNLDEVLKPNSEQIVKLQDYYNRVRERLNAASRP